MGSRDDIEITVIGCINTDVVSYVEKLPEEGETVFGSGIDFHFGGKGGNQAAQAALLFDEETPTEKVTIDCPFEAPINPRRQSADSRRSTTDGASRSAEPLWVPPKYRAKVALVGRLGTDSAARSFIRQFAALRIDTSGIVFDEKNPTGAAIVTVAKNGGNTIVYTASANSALSTALHTQDATKQLLEKSKVLVSENGILGAVSLECFRHAKLTNPNVITIYTAAPTEFVEAELACFIDYVIVNEIEAMALLRLWGQPTEEELAKVKDDLDVALELGKAVTKTANAFCTGQVGKGNVIVTNGARPCVLYMDGHVSQIPLAQKVPKERVVDTTGAGDSFAGAFAYFILQNPRTPTAAISKATYVAAESVQNYGACESYCGRKVLPHRLFL